MTGSDVHSPTPAFRDQLEQKVTEGFRRAEQEHDKRRSRWRSLSRIAAVLVVAVAIGSSTGLASAQIADRSRRDSLLDEAKSQLFLIGIRLELARAEVAAARARGIAGVAPGSEPFTSPEWQLRAAEIEARRLQFNIDEITATALAPRDELNAPLVGRRDFMSERLMLDMLFAQEQLVLAERSLETAVQREKVGATSTLSRMESDAEVVKRRARLGALAEKQKLRKEFLEKGTPIDELARRFEQRELMFHMMSAQQGLTLARERLAAMEKAHLAGTVDKLEVLRAELAMREAEVVINLLAKRVRATR